MKKIFSSGGGAVAPPPFFGSADDLTDRSGHSIGVESESASEFRFNEIFCCLLQLFESDQTLEEILLNGTRGMTLRYRATAVDRVSPFDDPMKMIDWLQDLSLSLGSRLDALQPFAGGMLKDQVFRWHCVLPPIVSEGPLFSLRRHRFEALKLDDFYLGSGLDQIRRGLGEGFPILIAGPTGAGKTSFLHALLAEYCSEERIFLIEQLAELPQSFPRWVRLTARAPNYEGFGEVTLNAIIAESLRLRPDRLVIGEIRGREARAFLETQSTGHKGALATIHANSVEGAVARLFDLAGLSLQEQHSWQMILKDLIVVRIDSEQTSGRSRIQEIRNPKWKLLLAKECCEYAQRKELLCRKRI